MQNNLLAFYFTSQLPDIEWETDSDALTVSLYAPANGGRILELTLTAVNAVVTLMEVREAVERFMRHHDLSHIAMVVQWKEPDSNTYTNSNTMQVYYCDKIITTSCSSWIEKHFLSTLESKPLPGPGATERLSFYTPMSISVLIRATVTCRLSSGEVRSIAISNYASMSLSVSSTGVINWTLADMLAKAQEVNEDAEEVLAVVIRAGNRTMAYYKRDMPANAAFAFRNCFGVQEIAWLHGVTVKKTKDDRKVASIAHRARLYDLNRTVAYEVETAPLPLEVALWIDQLLTSPLVWLGDGTRIVITDGEASISDDEAVMNTVKFTWQRDDARDDISIAAADVDIFVKPPFSHQFD